MFHIALASAEMTRLREQGTTKKTSRVARLATRQGLLHVSYCSRFRSSDVTLGAGDDQKDYVFCWNLSRFSRAVSARYVENCILLLLLSNRSTCSSIDATPGAGDDQEDFHHSRRQGPPSSSSSSSLHAQPFDWRSHPDECL